MAIILTAAALLAATPPLIEAPLPPCPPDYAEENIIPLGRRQIGTGAQPPYGDVLGDAWEMEEVACWRGTWLRRGRTELFDAYWKHPSGERVRATLQMFVNGRSVAVIRRHKDGQYCRYDGQFSADWRSVAGLYTCTWQRTPMQWRARIVRMRDVLPQVLN